MYVCIVMVACELQTKSGATGEFKVSKQEQAFDQDYICAVVSSLIRLNEELFMVRFRLCWAANRPSIFQIFYVFSTCAITVFANKSCGSIRFSANSASQTLLN